MRDVFKLLLIAPTALDSSGRPIRERRLHLPCLTLPYLAALTPEHVETTVIYDTIEPIPFEQHWDLVGLTGMGSGSVRAWQIADRFRDRAVRVVMGGVAVSISDPQWTLAHCDSVVRGEADDIWPTVLTDAMAGRLQSLYQVSAQPSIEGLPVPRYDLMNRRRIGLWRPVQATRGCPHTCSFCSVTVFGKNRFRTRPVEEVVRDVLAAKQCGSRYIAFVDDNMTAEPNYCARLWEALIPLNIIWMTQCSITIAEHPELLKLARQSGCRLVSIGIESTSQDSLRLASKNWNRPERYSEAITAFRRAGIDVSTEMIVGFDSDDLTAVDRTLDFIHANRISVPRVHILTPVPGTPLYEQMESEGRIIHRDFGSYTGSRAVFRTMHMRPSDLEQSYWNMYRELFNWRSIASRLLPPRAGIGLYMQLVVWAANIRYRRHVKARISPGIL